MIRKLYCIGAAAFCLIPVAMASGRLNAQELEKKDVSGAWELLCHSASVKLTVRDCALVQAVQSFANRNYWAKMGAEFTSDGQINLTVQTNPLWRRKDGVILSVDGLQLGLLPVDDCSTEFCVVSTILGPPLITKFLDGHYAEVQFPISDKDGVLLPFDLAGFGDGLAKLRSTVLAASIAEISGETIIATFGRSSGWLESYASDDKPTKFIVSLADGRQAGKGSPQETAGAVLEYALAKLWLCVTDKHVETGVEPITVSVTSRIRLSGADERQLDRFADGAKKCSSRSYFTITPLSPTDKKKGKKNGPSDPTLTLLQKYHVKQYLVDRGIKSARILGLEKPHEIPMYLPAE